LNAVLFPILPSPSETPLSLSSSAFRTNIPPSLSQPEFDSSGLAALNISLKRSSTSVPGISHMSSLTQRQSSLGPSPVKKRVNAIGAVSSHGRMYKVLGDFYLLAGRTEEAMVWFVSFIHFPGSSWLNSPQGTKRLPCYSRLGRTLYGMPLL
jgi:hypothetical protein